MANYVLQNGNLTTFSGTQDSYSMQVTSGNGYAQSATGQTFSMTQGYSIVGSVHINANSGSMGFAIEIFDTNGIPFSNAISFGGNAVNGGLTIPFNGILFPTKTAIGSIRVILSGTLPVVGFYFQLCTIDTQLNAICPSCSGTTVYTMDGNGNVTIPIDCPKCNYQWLAKPLTLNLLATKGSKGGFTVGGRTSS